MNRLLMERQKCLNFIKNIICVSEMNESLMGLKQGCQTPGGPQLGLGTDLGTFKGTYRIASVLPSIDSH